MQGLCTCTDVHFCSSSFTCPSPKSLLAPFPLLTQLLSANRLAHPEGSLPDLTMMSLTASLEKPEVKQLAVFSEEKPECSEKAEKSELGKDSEEDEEDEDEDEEETSGNPPTAGHCSENGS